MLVLAFSLLGCAATVTAEGIEGGFGLGLSAVLRHVEAGSFTAENVVIANFPDYCLRYQRVLDAISASFDVEAQSTDDDYCAEMEPIYRELSESLNAIYFEGANWFAVYSTSYDVDEYEFGEQASGSLLSWTSSPYADVMADFDASSTAKDGCGMDSEDSDDDLADEWSITEGSLEITVSEGDDGSTSGSIDATMEGQGKSASDGDIIASFTASWCELDMGDVLSYDE